MTEIVRKVWDREERSKNFRQKLKLCCAQQRMQITCSGGKVRAVTHATRWGHGFEYTPVIWMFGVLLWYAGGMCLIQAVATFIWIRIEQIIYATGIPHLSQIYMLDMILFIKMFIYLYHYLMLRAGRSGDRIPVGARFSAPVQNGSEVHPASCTVGTGSFPAVNQPGRGVDHPPHLAPRLKKELSYTSTPPLGLRGPFCGELYIFTFTFTSLPEDTSS